MEMADRTDTDSTIAHNDVTLKLAQEESAEHMSSMSEVFETMQQKPLRLKARSIGSSTGAENCKTAFLVRHGQGFHNLLADHAKAAGRSWKQFDATDPNNPYTTPEIRDAPLTEKGRRQAYALQPRVAGSNVELVVLSPNCRALQTGCIVFDGCCPTMIAHEMVREETGAHICDARRSTQEQKAEFPNVDFSLLDPEDPLYTPDQRESKLSVAHRIYQFLEWLESRPERVVGVASHSGWLLTLMNGVVECEEESLKAWFQTGEMRTVELQFVRE